MKSSILFLFIAFFTTSTLYAQISVDSFDRQPKVNIDDIDQFAAISATSTCGQVDVKVNEQMFSGGCLGNLVRTYIFTDECGNEEKVEQYIVLQDNTPPQFIDAPKDILAYSNAIPVKADLQAVDNGKGQVEVDFSEKSSDGQIVRNWVATDQCGNQTAHTQIIALQDPQASKEN
jgi:large repetitive protein